MRAFQPRRRPGRQRAPRAGPLGGHVQHRALAEDALVSRMPFRLALSLFESITESHIAALALYRVFIALS